jgi:hypothetical protein
MDYSRFSSLGQIMEVEKVVDVVHAKTGKCYRLGNLCTSLQVASYLNKL